jgi:hypothetical protein
MYDRRHLFVELPPNVGGMPLWAMFRPYPRQLLWSPFQPWDSPLGFSSYNALQITLNKRFSHGINWLANYTFSKSLGNIDSDFQNWGPEFETGKVSRRFRAPAGAALAAARLSERSRVIESIAKKVVRHHAQVTKNFKEENLCFRLHSGPDADHM